jgi:seryl-tRNA synthetase
MHDVKAIRDDPDAFARGWRARGLGPPVDQILALDQQLRAAQTALQDCQSRRNEASKLIGQAKAKKDQSAAQLLMAEVETLKGEIAAFTEEERALGDQLRDLLAGLPNIPAADVPEGPDESGNVEQHRRGEPRAGGPAKDHADLGEALGMLDFETAARMSGARFVVVKGQLARLERAIAHFMLDLQTGEHGYTEVSPPLLVRDEAMFGTGQLPKFFDDQFIAFPGFAVLETYAQQYARSMVESLLERHPGLSWQEADALRHVDEVLTATDPDLNRRLLGGLTEPRWLIPTAEVSLTNLVREQITAEDALPIRVTALTNCFRAEAGASGKDTKGIIRQHQFQKVELVSVTTPEQSEEEHERMTACAEAVLERLELPYRRMLLCTGDMGFTAKKTYDLEVWLPSQGTYREISSCSNCGDFQARRMDARIRKAGEKGTRFAHTLNGSGLAVGRTLVAVMENYQDEGGKIAVPAAVQPYMGGLTQIG